MIPIYICDDDAVMCDMMKNCLEKQILMGGYDMKITVCARQPEKLLEATDGEAEQGIYFLDVDLKGASMDGFRLGQEIRRRDGRGFLIYVTAFPDLAFETFRYHLEALDYIVKGDQEETAAQVIRCLRVIGERVSREKGRSRRYFTVKAGDVVRHIPLEDILYFVTSGRTHRIELHGDRERLDFIGSIQELEQELGQRFLRSHRAYLVNSDRIQGADLKRRELLLDNGERCPFSRMMKKEMMDRLGSQMNCSGIFIP